MIIEIKDLPEGRNVKNIVFDITFEDGQVEKVNPIIKESKFGPGNSGIQENTSIDFPVLREETTKEVPPEMLDIEF